MPLRNDRSCGFSRSFASLLLVMAFAVATMPPVHAEGLPTSCEQAAHLQPPIGGAHNLTPQQVSTLRSAARLWAQCIDEAHGHEQAIARYFSIVDQVMIASAENKFDWCVGLAVLGQNATYPDVKRMASDSFTALCGDSMMHG